MKDNVKEFEIKLDKEWKDALNQAYKKKIKDIKIDGFRKGTCPMDVYIKKFGIESLYMDAADIAITDAYRKLLSDNKDLIPALEPKVDITGISDSNVIFKFTVIERPEIKLGAYKNLGIEKEKAKVSAEEVNNEIKRLQESMADLVIKEKGKIEEGNTAVIDFKGFVNGEELDGGSGENFPLEIGSHQFIPGFEEGLVGHKAGDKVTLDLKFPENYMENLKNKDVTFEVEIKEVKMRLVPEVNEDLFKDLGYDDIKTIDEFKKKVKKNLMDDKERQLEDQYMEKCLEKAADNMKVDLNEEIIDDEVHHMMHQYEDQLRMQGLDIEKYYELTGQTHEDLHKQMEPEAIKRVKYRYLIEEIAQKEDIKFTDKEVEKEAKKMAENYGISLEELIKAYGNLEVVKYDMTMHKAIEIIKENNK